MGSKQKFSKGIDPASSSSDESGPTLIRRSANHHSTLKSGRTIGGQREKVETANERMIAHQKNKHKKRLRAVLVSLVFFSLAIAAIAAMYFNVFCADDSQSEVTTTEEVSYDPTVEIIDEDAAVVGGEVSGRMKSYIGQAESDFRDLGYYLTKVVIPANMIREIDFYLDGYTGFIKMSVDRATAVSVEDADRMIRYLAGQGISEFSYIDVRVPYKAYWK